MRPSRRSIGTSGGKRLATQGRDTRLFWSLGPELSIEEAPCLSGMKILSGTDHMVRRGSFWGRQGVAGMRMPAMRASALLSLTYDNWHYRALGWPAVPV